MERKVYEVISKQTSDPIVQRKTCKWTGEDFPIFQGDIDLLRKVSPTIGGVQYDLPLPTLSPKARHIRRLMRRNDRKIYKTTCKITKKPLVTCYHPDVETNIVDHTERYKSVDNMKYGRDYDFGKSFNQQLSDLISQTEKKNILTVGFMQNSEYTHNVGDMKNCYMMFDTGMCEDCLYGVRVVTDKNVVDAYEVHDCENVYDGISIYKSRNVFYSQNCETCSYGAFLYNCVGCNNCICCTNQVNKNYWVCNKQVSKEEFQKTRKDLLDGTMASYQRFQSQYELLLKHSFRKNMNMTNCQDSIGHNILNGKDIFLCEEMTDVQNMRYCDRINGYGKAGDSMDISSRGWNMSRCYELNCCGSDHATSADNCHFSSYLFRGVNNAQYSLHIPSMCDYIFGCGDIDKKSFCILNKQYTHEEYEKIIPQIIAHMQTTGERGEFLDPTYSPFPYNDTIASDYYPVHSLRYPDGTTKVINPKGRGVMTVHEPDKKISAATLDLGGEIKITTTRKTRELEVNVPENLQRINAGELPEDIHDVTDDITRFAIICEKSDRPFRIVQQELDFYRKHGIPLPRLHPDMRHIARLEKVTPFDLYQRTCDNCGIEMLSVYKRDSEFQVYCEGCYNKEIY